LLEWDSRDLGSAEDQWSHNAGLLEGGMLTLAAFVLVVAVINRHLAYFIFALWLIVNYRGAAISAGWDFNWLNHAIPSSSIYPVRQLTFAALNILTVVLMTDLFADGLRKIGRRPLVHILHFISALLLISALVLDYGRFLPIMWMLNATGISIIAYLLISILIATKSRVAMWFAASMGIMLLSSMYEIAAASMGLRGLIGTVNSVTASLASSLLAALAIAEHLRKARSDHVKTYRVSPVGLATIGTDGTLLRMNESFAYLAGTKVNKVESHWSDFFPADVLSNMRDEMRGEDGPVEIVFSVPSGDSEHWYELTAIKSDDGNVETALNDITERKLSNDRLHWLADHDPLTSLLNRRGLNTALAEAATALSQNRTASLAYIDLNRFKLANDLYGHSTGDQLLKQVTGRLTEQMMPGETIARVGGDEFVIVFLDVQLARAKRRCEELLDAIANPLYRLGSDGRTIRLSASLGLVEMAEGNHSEDAIAAADQACRAAKRDSGAGLVVYPQESSAFGERLAELRLIKRMDGAEDFSRILRLNFQPLLKLSDPFANLDFEVLLRATDPNGTQIPAYRIINSAEKAGYMQRVDLWVLESTLQFLEAHPVELNSTGLACVNLSGASLNDESFVANVGACLRNYPTVAKKVCFEITEAVALHDLANTRRWIEQQRHEGAKVALDDFGAGYSSFAYLRELPADALKIDGAFVRSMARHASNQSIVQVMIDLAHNLGMATVAECVEDLTTMTMLWELGADYLQGFVLAKPMSGDELLQGLSSWDLITDPRARKLIMDTSGVKPPPPVRLASGHLPI
jgi:diguanylate cyclase (GGDEF)-like protein